MIDTTRTSSPKTFSDQAIAARMLKARERGVYTFGHYLRINAKGYGPWLGGIAIVLALFGYLGAWIPFSFVLGFTIALLSRDCAWLKAQRLMWPFVVKVVDWEKVEHLAKAS